MYYLCAKPGFVTGVNSEEEGVIALQYTRDVRLAKPFTTWQEADQFAKLFLKGRYYAVLPTFINPEEQQRRPGAFSILQQLKDKVMIFN